MRRITPRTAASNVKVLVTSGLRRLRLDARQFR